jgi:hypothetical protein
MGDALYGLLAHIPAWLALIVLAAIPTAIFTIVHYVIIRLVSEEVLLPHRDVAGFLVAVVGVVYAVALGFVVVTVWVQFTNAQQIADTEAGDVGEIAALALLFPEPTRTHLRSTIANYAFEVRDREWPLLANGKQDLHARSLLLDAVNIIVRNPLRKSGGMESEMRHFLLEENALGLMQNLSEQRRNRLIASSSHLQDVLYLALGIGGIILMTFVYLFGLSNHKLQLVMTALVAGSISLLFAVVVELDRPFSGNIRVSRDAWTLVIQNNGLDRYRTSPAISQLPER